MAEDKKPPEVLEDKVLDHTRGGYSDELTNATVSGIRTEQMARAMARTASSATDLFTQG